MQSLMAAAMNPERVGRILMGDPNWNDGQYYGKSFPRMGMQHARWGGTGRGVLPGRLTHFPCREVGTITYRSGPEWAMRFGHHHAEPGVPPDFCPDFEVERYLDHQVREGGECESASLESGCPCHFRETRSALAMTPTPSCTSPR